MGWIYRKAGQHRCEWPPLKETSTGDLWQCDVCGQIYIVDFSSNDAYFRKASQREIDRTK